MPFGAVTASACLTCRAAQDWSDSRVVTGGTQTVLKDIVVDDHFIGVAAVARAGAESLVTFDRKAARLPGVELLED